MTAPACPDCGAPVTERIVHTDTCPLLAALERTSADDARWFQRHPDRPRRVRNTTPAERAEQALLQPDATPDTMVTVRNLGRGAHGRSFGPSGRSDVEVTVTPAAAPVRRGGAR